MPHALFDAHGFHAALDSLRQARNLTWKQVAEQSGVNSSTLTRMGRDRKPDADSLVSLLTWSRLDIHDFIQGPTPPQLNPHADHLSQIGIHLRADKNLSPEAAEAIDAVIKAAYARLRRREENGPNPLP